MLPNRTSKLRLWKLSRSTSVAFFPMDKATSYSTKKPLTVFQQPEANIATAPWKMWEWHVVKTDVGKMNLVVTRVKDSKQQQKSRIKAYKRILWNTWEWLTTFSSHNLKGKSVQHLFERCSTGFFISHTTSTLFCSLQHSQFCKSKLSGLHSCQSHPLVSLLLNGTEICGSMETFEVVTFVNLTLMVPVKLSVFDSFPSKHVFPSTPVSWHVTRTVI